MMLNGTERAFLTFPGSAQAVFRCARIAAGFQFPHAPAGRSATISGACRGAFQHVGRPCRAPLAAFRHVGYRRYFFSRLLAYFAVQIMSVAVGWQIYDLTRILSRSVCIGLSSSCPPSPSSRDVQRGGSLQSPGDHGHLHAGQQRSAAQHFPFDGDGAVSPWPVYAILVVFGIERAFLGPLPSRWRPIWCLRKTCPMQSPGTRPPGRRR